MSVHVQPSFRHVASGWGVTMALGPQQNDDRTTSRKMPRDVFRELEHGAEKSVDDTEERAGGGQNLEMTPDA